MSRPVVLTLIAGLACLFASAASSQSLAPGRAIVWPREFPVSEDAPEMSCNALAKARAAYMSTPRPAFNCTDGVDCPADLQPAPPQSMGFSLFYSWADIGRRDVDVTISPLGVEIIKASVERTLRDMDKVARSRSREVHVIGHTDTWGTPEQQQRVSEKLARCVGDAMDIAIHLNGYQGAYDFPVTLDARGESELARQTADGVREPMNRRGEITITY